LKTALESPSSNPPPVTTMIARSVDNGIIIKQLLLPYAGGVM
jgi:hypothetical protein